MTTMSTLLASAAASKSHPLKGKRRNVQLPNDQRGNDSLRFPAAPSLFLRPRVGLHPFLRQVSLPRARSHLKGGSGSSGISAFPSALSSGGPLANASASAGGFKLWAWRLR